MDAVIYLGVAVNIIGALALMFYAFRYYKSFKESERLTVKKEDLKRNWMKKRTLCFGLMIGGAIIAIIGCYL